MQLNPPTKVVWFISLFLGVLGILFYIVNFLGELGFVMLVIGFVLLVIATMLKKL